MAKVFGIEKIHFVYDKAQRVNREETREILSVYLQDDSAKTAIKSLFKREELEGHSPIWLDDYRFETASFTEMGVDGVSFEFNIVELLAEMKF